MIWSKGDKEVDKDWCSNGSERRDSAIVFLIILWATFYTFIRDVDIGALYQLYADLYRQPHNLRQICIFYNLNSLKMDIFCMDDTSSFIFQTLTIRFDILVGALEYFCNL